jgi:hypothetical protein
MGTDRININAPTIKEDGAFQNDLRSAKSVDDIVRASQSLRERAQGVVYDPVSGQYRESAPAASATEREFTTKTVEIGGREFTFTASSEAEMAALISNAQLVAENVAAPARGEVRRGLVVFQRKVVEECHLNVDESTGRGRFCSAPY